MKRNESSRSIGMKQVNRIAIGEARKMLSKSYSIFKLIKVLGDKKSLENIRYAYVV